MERVEQSGTGEQIRDGAYWLRALGADELLGQTVNGIPAEDFLDVCGEHARPLLEGWAAMDPKDPLYDQFKNLLLNKIHEQLGIKEPGH